MCNFWVSYKKIIFYLFHFQNFYFLYLILLINLFIFINVCRFVIHIIYYTFIFDDCILYMCIYIRMYICVFDFGVRFIFPICPSSFHHFTLVRFSTLSLKTGSVASVSVLAVRKRNANEIYRSRTSDTRFIHIHTYMYVYPTSTYVTLTSHYYNNKLI